MHHASRTNTIRAREHTRGSRSGGAFRSERHPARSLRFVRAEQSRTTIGIRFRPCKHPLHRPSRYFHAPPTATCPPLLAFPCMHHSNTRVTAVHPSKTCAQKRRHRFVDSPSPSPSPAPSYPYAKCRNITNSVKSARMLVRRLFQKEYVERATPPPSPILRGQEHAVRSGRMTKASKLSAPPRPEALGGGGGDSPTLSNLPVASRGRRRTRTQACQLAPSLP